MKRIFTFGFFMVLLGFAHLMHAQNNRTLERFDGNSYHKVEVAPGMSVKSIDENSYVTHGKIQNQPSEKGNNWKLKINFVGNETHPCYIAIGNGLPEEDENYYFDLVNLYYPETSYEVTLPEGLYDILINGGRSDDKFACISFEQALIDKDTELTANTDVDAIHKISTDPININNNTIGPLTQTEDGYYDATLH
jgi:hypothetical protein